MTGLRNIIQVKYLVVALVLLLLMTACAPRDNSKIKGYGNDGYLGTTNSHPGLPTNPDTYHTYRYDENLIAQTLDGIQEIERYRYRINGGNLHVKIQLADTFKGWEIETIESNVYDQLAYMLPRYKVHVSGHLRHHQK
ncbi:hypothetical protein [Marinicrinis sediminis]|uniref:Lipoprotein n=1 Tax=Marinicrinis sediminis TaxID=1652465 RepID=A0ABW5REC1_9BACL